MSTDPDSQNITNFNISTTSIGILYFSQLFRFQTLRPNKNFKEQKFGKQADIANIKIEFVDEVDPLNGFYGSGFK